MFYTFESVSWPRHLQSNYYRKYFEIFSFFMSGKTGAKKKLWTQVFLTKVFNCQIFWKLHKNFMHSCKNKIKRLGQWNQMLSTEIFCALIKLLQWPQEQYVLLFFNWCKTDAPKRHLKDRPWVVKDNQTNIYCTYTLTLKIE